MKFKKIIFYSFWGIKILVALTVVSILLRGLWESISPPDRTSQYYAEIKKELSHSNFHGYTTRQVLREQPFQIVALSDMAVGLMNLDKRQLVNREELLPLIDEIKVRALSPHVSTYTSINAETDFTTGGIDGLYLSHLNLILGIHQYLHQASSPDSLQTAITTTLYDRSLAEPDFHVPSFRHGDKWPADQAVTLLSLYVYDQLNGTDYSGQPIEQWFHFMDERMIDGETGLYKSSIAQRWYMDIPRGTAHSWMIFYMAQFAPKEAEELYSNYRKVMWKEFLGIGGFREWPSGRNGHMNIDTGPIVRDIGSSATALALGSTRLMNDTHHYTLVMRLFSLLGIPHFSPLIGKTILFSGETATLWFTDYQPQEYSTPPASAFFLSAIYLLCTAVLCFIILFFDVTLHMIIIKIRNLLITIKNK